MPKTSLGFFDLATAAPSMKAALAAWGADSNSSTRAPRSRATGRDGSNSSATSAALAQN
jgi:hypothetical protein